MRFMESFLHFRNGVLIHDIRLCIISVLGSRIRLPVHEPRLHHPLEPIAIRLLHITHCGAAKVRHFETRSFDLTANTPLDLFLERVHASGASGWPRAKVLI
uniref:Uncharacterized protein n=1 Tax=Cacopsylla melanoneura TaxID=428564 RepID=A0A8D8ZP14_9HEMI